MAEVCVIYGVSGAGKSRSLLNFAEDEILLVNVSGKRLPFKKKFKYVLQSDDVSKILTWLYKMPTKIAVIDDAGFVMVNHFMREHSTPKHGSDQFKLYNDIADGFHRLITECRKLPDDKIIYLIMHEDTSDMGATKLRTIGKLLDQKCPVESLVTVCLRCLVETGGKHVFRTQNTGGDVSKSPEGMLPEVMENDLKAVDTAIREYWELPASYPLDEQPATKEGVKVSTSDRLGD